MYLFYDHTDEFNYYVDIEEFMETTRHFVTTTFIVNGNKTLLHNHKKLDLALPAGGHIDRDELPHKAAKREVIEETGLDVEFQKNKS